ESGSHLRRLLADIRKRQLDFADCYSATAENSGSKLAQRPGATKWALPLGSSRGMMTIARPTDSISFVGFGSRTVQRPFAVYQLNALAEFTPRL
ncbi:MAG TPA: hypothetical protein VF089_03535, partial [Candidatus Binatia bacterium]